MSFQFDHAAYYDVTPEVVAAASAGFWRFFQIAAIIIFGAVVAFAWASLFGVAFASVTADFIYNLPLLATVLGVAASLCLYRAFGQQAALRFRARSHEALRTDVTVARIADDFDVPVPDVIDAFVTCVVNAELDTRCASRLGKKNALSMQMAKSKTGFYLAVQPSRAVVITEVTV